MDIIIYLLTHPIYIWIVCIILFFILFIVYKNKWTEKFKGKIGEFWVKRDLRKLSNQEYLILNDVLLLDNTTTSQIDHIIVSDYGIFVIETKFINGYIEGNEYDHKWIIHGKKTEYYIMNPIHQNYGHMIHLKNVLHLTEEQFIPIVCFFNDDNANIHLQENHKNQFVSINELLPLIMSYQKKIIFNKEEIYQFIVAANITDRKIRKGHVVRIKKSTSETTSSLSNIHHQAIFCQQTSHNAKLRIFPFQAHRTQDQVIL